MYDVIVAIVSEQSAKIHIPAVYFEFQPHISPKTGCFWPKSKEKH